MPLCDACAALRLRDLRSPAGYQLHARAKDVVASSRACELCALIRAALLQDLSSRDDDDDDDGARLRDALPDEPIVLYGSYAIADEDMGLEADDDDDKEGEDEDGEGRLVGIDVHVGLDDNLNIVNLNLFTVPEPGAYDNNDDDVAGRPLLDDAGSDAALALLRTWLRTCVEEHPQCRGTFAGLETPGDGDDDDAPPQLPTRVLDVGAAGAPALRLFVSGGARAPYAALSHCWGAAPRFLTTTTGNLAAHCAALPPAGLTQTFLDAVRVTRALGLRYLWIDSLCIVQDSPADWAAESARMGHVYQRAELTIAATGAPDGRGGCFLARPAPYARVRLARLRDGDDDDSAAAAARPPVYAGLYPDQAACSLSKSPLGERAWITQEWLFSRRTVHYTRARMVWSCKARLESEDGEGVARMDEQRLHHSLARYRRWKEEGEGQAAAGGRDPLGPPVGFYSDWCDLVATYTARALTYATDKPVAILSLALDVQQRLGERWQHGLFHGPYPVPDGDDAEQQGDDDEAARRYLALQLLWFGKRVLDRPAALAHQPTWSWLSTMGPVNVHAPARVAGPVVSRLRISEQATGGDDGDGDGDGSPKRPFLAVTGPLQPAATLDRAIRVAHPESAAEPQMLAHRRADEGARFFSRSSFHTGAAIMPLGTCHFFGADPGPHGALRVRTGWGSFDDGRLPPLDRLHVAALSRNVLGDGVFDGYNVLYLVERPGGGGGGFVRVGMGEILLEEVFVSAACHRSYRVY